MSNINIAASAAGLTPEQKKQIEKLSKALETHKTLLNLPAPVAEQAYQAKLTESERQDLKNKFGEKSPQEEPPRGWLRSAWHYTGKPVIEFAQAASDFSTRVARTGIIALEEGRYLKDAWDRAEKDGQKVFNEKRLNKATAKYGEVVTGLAKRIKSGEKPAEIIATATPEEQYWLQIADKTVKNINGISDKKIRADRDLFDEALAAVNAAQYSPGRFVANKLDAVIPGDLYKFGLFYKVTSGAFDAAYRIFADPLILIGKGKRLYDVNKYAYEVILSSARQGGDTAAKYFAKDSTVAFWNTYGEQLNKIRTATERGERAAAAAARIEAQRIAPEFGPAVINLFNKNKISDVDSAKAFFYNSDDAFNLISAGTARRRIIMPKLDPVRKARLKVLTSADRVFSIDDVGPKLVDNMFGYPETDDGIYKALVEDRTKIVEAAQGLKVKGVERLRFSSADIARRYDNAKRKFTRIPLFRNDQFNLRDADAPDKIYQLAAIALPTRESRLIAETFRATDDIGRRKDIYDGLWNTLVEIRGVNKFSAGQNVARLLRKKGKEKYSLTGTDDYIEFGVLPSEMNDIVTAPSLLDLDTLAGKSGIVSTIVGLGNSKWAEKMTNYWSFFTLAGPRYAIRNATEDLMVNLAIGNSVWGIAKNRYLATRLNTAIQLAPGLTRAEKIASDPLGIIMRFVNKNQADVYTDEIKAIQTTLAAQKQQLADLGKVVKANSNANEVATAKANIARIRKEMEEKGGVVEQTRTILAQALTEGRTQAFLKKFKINLLDDEGVELLKEQVLFGDVDNLLSIISEGGFNFAAGSNYIDGAYDAAKALGVRQAELRLDLDGLKEQYGVAASQRGFREIGIIKENEASMIAWALRISFYGNDELGSIALANLSDDPTEAANAIKAIREWLNDPKNKKLVNDSRLLAGRDLSLDEYSKIVYNRAKALMTKSGDGKINTELLDKIRVFDDQLGRYRITGKLTMDDLNELDEAAIPKAVVGPELVPVSDTNNYTAPLMEKGWVWLGLSNARISRQPIALNEMVRIRKQMRKAGFEKAYLDNFVKDFTDPEKKAAALVNGRKELAKLVEERATQQILAYVDNPLIRSQASFSLRNFARFYRAQEDFFRRFGRIVRYNPEALQRLLLTWDGVAHSGWIQEDDRGEKYFVYPHFAPGYKAIQGFLRVFGIEQDFKVPFPVQFGGSVKMITPSIDTESWIPTFSGPAAALPMTLLENISDIFKPGMGDTIARYTLGRYAVDQSLVSRLLPAHVNRFVATFDQDERNSQYASAYRKAITYLESAGHGVTQRFDEEGNLIPPSPAELEDYRQRLRSTTLGILATRFAFGFLAPASPSVQLKSDMSEWIRDAGNSNWKQTFNALREQYDGDYDKAMQRWVELYPNQVPYTVTESERKTVAFFGFAEESGRFVEQNGDLFKEHPEGAAFLIPHKGAFSFDTYKTMSDMGLRTNKRVEDYLREVQTAADRQTYFDRRDQYEQELELAPTDFARSIARQEFNDWKDRFFAGRPLVREELNQGAEKQIKRIEALDDLQNMLNNPKYANVKPETQRVLKKMMDSYTSYKEQKEILELTGGDSAFIQSLKDSTISELRGLATFNENTQAAYDALFGSLLGD
jgi:hypothetical protein